MQDTLTATLRLSSAALLLFLSIAWAEAADAPSTAKSDEEFSFQFAGYPKPGEIQVYKGKALVGSSYPDVKNTSFFKNVKLAIDLTESLPQKLRNDIDLIKVIIFDPPSKHRPKNDVYTNTIGVYSIGPDFFQQAPVILYTDPKWVAAVQITYSLVGNGVSARQHRTMMSLMKKIKAATDTKSAEYIAMQTQLAELVANLNKTDLQIVNKYRCQSLLAIFEAMKVWEKNAQKRDVFAKDLSSRKCW